MREMTLAKGTKGQLRNTTAAVEVACRTGVIFCVFQSNKGESEASAKCESLARGGVFTHLPSHASRASRSPRFCLAITPVLQATVEVTK